MTPGVFFATAKGPETRFVGLVAIGCVGVAHALRKAAIPEKFSRKISVRSLGENITADVENCICSQVKKERFVDPAFAAKMEGLVSTSPQVDLSRPFRSGSGTY